MLRREATERATKSREVRRVLNKQDEGLFRKSIPTPNDPFLKELETLLFSFIWGGKCDKMAKKTIINDIEDGGLKMTDIRSFAKALKISWIKKAWDANYQADWKRPLYSDRLYWNDVWLLNKRSLSLLACSFVENTFWRNVVESWAEYVQETVEARDLLSQPLWNNVFIKIENKSVFYTSWYMKNLRYVNDLVDESDVFMSPTELINKFNLKCTLLQAYAIICTIPSSWKSKIREFGKRLPVVKSQNVERLFKTTKVTSFTYDILRKSVAIQPSKVHRKWNKHLPSPVEDWSTYCRIPFLCTNASKLRSFQYRILHRTIDTNVLLKEMGVKDHDDCFFCDCNPETIEQLFGTVTGYSPLSALANWIWLVTQIEMEFSLESVLLGYTNCMTCKNAINCIILVVKFFIYKGRNPDFASVQSYLKFHYNIEKFACDLTHQDKILSKWKPMTKLFC